MVEKKGMERFAPLSGLAFLVLAVVAFSIAGEPPDADSPAVAYQAHWRDHESEQVASAIIAAYAAVAFLWFAGSVREAVARVEPGAARLGSLVMGGAALVSTGILITCALQLIAAERANDVSPDVTKTMGLLYENFWFPMAGGMAVFMLAAGIGAVRHGAFDARLGWIAIGLGLISLTPAGLVAFVGSMIWAALAAVVLYRKKDPVGSGAEPPQRGGPPIEMPPGAEPGR